MLTTELTFDRNTLAAKMYATLPAVNPQTGETLPFNSTHSAATRRNASAYEWADDALSVLKEKAVWFPTDTDKKQLLTDYTAFYILANNNTIDAYFKIKEMREQND